ncbi:MAG: transcriptional regulator MraZ [Betaproteobacteria bacterium]|nr:transcriptional regulator MraZ [Betaproteobacteria bacterium]
MFQGATQLSIDAKGRLAVPTRHRDALQSSGAVVLTAHPDGCVLLYPRLAWEPIGARIQALPSFDERSRWWQRLLVGFAEEIELDAQGRMLVSPALRKFGNLQKDVMLVGQGSHFEIWDGAGWEEKLASARGQVGSGPPPGAEDFSL